VRLGDTTNSLFYTEAFTHLQEMRGFQCWRNTEPKCQYNHLYDMFILYTHSGSDILVESDLLLPRIHLFLTSVVT